MMDAAADDDVDVILADEYVNEQIGRMTTTTASSSNASEYLTIANEDDSISSPLLQTSGHFNGDNDGSISSLAQDVRDLKQCMQNWMNLMLLHLAKHDSKMNEQMQKNCHQLTSLIEARVSSEFNNTSPSSMTSFRCSKCATFQPSSTTTSSNVALQQRKQKSIDALRLKRLHRQRNFTSMRLQRQKLDYYQKEYKNCAKESLSNQNLPIFTSSAISYDDDHIHDEPSDEFDEEEQKALNESVEIVDGDEMPDWLTTAYENEGRLRQAITGGSMEAESGSVSSNLNGYNNNFVDQILALKTAIPATGAGASRKKQQKCCRPSASSLTKVDDEQGSASIIIESEFLESQPYSLGSNNNNNVQSDRVIARSWKNEPTFPSQLFNMLNTDTTGSARWTDDGEAFWIDFKKFEANYIKSPHQRFGFTLSTIGSFHRQINLYNFQRTRKVPSSESADLYLEVYSGFLEYKHAFFKRDFPELLVHVRRPRSTTKRNSNSLVFDINSGSNNVGIEQQHQNIIGKRSRKGPTPQHNLPWFQDLVQMQTNMTSLNGDFIDHSLVDVPHATTT